MKAGLLIVSLSLVAFAQANYNLSCAKSELSIRWPSYDSNSEYHVCSRLFGRKMTVSCNPGEVFTFVLQSCTSPNRYIPAPALEALPTAAPLASNPNEDGFLTPLVIPEESPVLSPPSVKLPVLQSYNGPPTIAPVGVVEESNPHEDHPPQYVVEEANKVTPPLPPTPAPTPPLVEKETSKKPAGKKPAAKKKKATTSNKKHTVSRKEKIRKPKVAAGQKVTAQKKAKQSSKAEKRHKKTKVTNKKILKDN